MVRRMFSRWKKSWIFSIPKCWKGMMQKERDDPRKAKRKGKSLEVELDLSGKFSRESMLRSSLENEKEAHFGGFGQV